MIARLAAAAGMLAVAVVLVLLARDAWHWGRAVRDGDARAYVEGVAPDAWSADATLPWGLARRALGLDDDLEFRRVVTQAAAAASKEATAGSRKVRGPIETALARIERSDSDPARRSRAADYLGVLLYTDPPAPRASESPYGSPGQPGESLAEQTPEQRATAQFALAAQLDPGNANAKRNLEAMLQQAKPPSQRGTPRPGGGDRIGNRGSGSRPAGRGY